MFKMRTMITLIMLIFCSYTDIKERNIYILPVFVTGIIGIILSMIEMMKEPVNMYNGLMFEWIISPFVIGVIAVVTAYASKGNIGEGDGYVIATIGFVLGFHMQIVVIFIAAFVGAAVSGIILMATAFGRVYSIRSIPYVPVITAAFIVELIAKYVYIQA